MSTEIPAAAEAAPPRRWGALAAFAIATAAVASSGALFMPGEWYESLRKPSWNPPSWIFGPVWTVLYVAMTISAWLCWRHAPSRRLARLFAVAWSAQLLLNALWSPLFFGLHRPFLALLDITALFFAIVVTTALAWRCHRPSAALLVPYAVWVSFAGLLNAALWMLNR